MKYEAKDFVYEPIDKEAEIKAKARFAADLAEFDALVEAAIPSFEYATEEEIEMLTKMLKEKEFCGTGLVFQSQAAPNGEAS